MESLELQDYQGEFLEKIGMQRFGKNLERYIPEYLLGHPKGYATSREIMNMSTRSLQQVLDDLSSLREANFIEQIIISDFGKTNNVYYYVNRNSIIHEEQEIVEFFKSIAQPSSSDEGEYL